ASHWLGAAWAAGLTACGVAGATVHRGGLGRTAWSDRACFAGLGPGEVTLVGRKVVGISQRRTRHAARFQCVALARWDPEALAALLVAPPGHARAELGGVATGVAVALDDMAAAVL